MPLLETTRAGLLTVGTSTLTGILNRRGLRNMFMQDVNPVRITQARMVGLAFTMRFIPSREDKQRAECAQRRCTHVQAMEECRLRVRDRPARRSRAASAGELASGGEARVGHRHRGGLRDSGHPEDGVARVPAATELTGAPRNQPLGTQC